MILLPALSRFGAFARPGKHDRHQPVWVIAIIRNR